jgi:hypothetical protein
MCPTPKPLVCVFALVAATASPAAAGDAPARGTVQTLPVLSVSVAVGSTGRETKRAVYAPPPGWYVRSHRVVVASKHGTVTYAVSTVPAKWDWKTEEQAGSIGRSIAAGAVSAYKISGGGQVATSREDAAADRQAVASSHHLLVLEVDARGCGFLQSGSGVELTVVAEMVYLGR